MKPFYGWFVSSLFVLGMTAPGALAAAGSKSWSSSGSKASNSEKAVVNAQSPTLPPPATSRPASGTYRGSFNADVNTGIGSTLTVNGNTVTFKIKGVSYTVKGTYDTASKTLSGNRSVSNAKVAFSIESITKNEVSVFIEAQLKKHVDTQGSAYMKKE